MTKFNAKFTITNEQEIRKTFAVLGNDLEKEIGKVINRTSLSALNDAQVSMRNTLRDTTRVGSSRGSSGLRSRRHFPSLPGSPPAPDTGFLIRSGKVKGWTKLFGKITGTVQFTAKYARYLEYGTKYIEARPFLKPAIHKQLPKLKQNMIKALNAAVRRNRRLK